MKNRSGPGGQVIKQYHIFILIVITIFGFILRFYDLENYSFWNDEIISIVASRGILNHGVPLMPEGTIYFKSPLHIYSLAAVIKIFGMNEYSARILSVIYGTLTIIMVYITGYNFSEKNKLVGISAALVYALSIWSIAWAREARFYQQFQFFSLLTIYFFWSAYIKSGSSKNIIGNIGNNLSIWKQNKYIILAIICFILAMLSSKLAIILLPPLILVILIKYGFRGLIKPKIILSLIIITASWIFFQSMPIIFSFDTKNLLLETDIIGFNLESVYQNIVGFGFFLLVNLGLTIFIILGIFIKKWRKMESFWFLYSFIFICSSILILMVDSPIFRSRYYYFLFPIIVITVCISAYHISELLIDHIKHQQDYITYGSIGYNKNSVMKTKKMIAKKNVIGNIYIFIIFIAILLIADPKIINYQTISTDPSSEIQFTIGDVPLHPDYKGCCEYIQDNYLTGDCILVKRVRPVEFYLKDYLEKNNDLEDYLVIDYYNLTLNDIQTVFQTYRVWLVIDDPIDALIPRFISQDEFDFIEEHTMNAYESKDQYTVLRLEN